MSFDLSGHIALVTGAARGIGLAVAQRLWRDGARVVLADLDLPTAQAAATALGERALALQLDVGDEAQVESAFAATESRFGSVTLLVNNAGHVHQAPCESIPVAEFDRMIRVHLRGSFLCTRRALVPMLAAGHGAIVNMASQLGQIGGVELVHYSAAKAGLIGMTKALAREVSARGVRVNAVAPGPINTELVRALSADWQRRKAAELPLGHFGEPDDVAATVAFLASSDGRLYVGQTLGPNSGDVML
jgi:3-oxoacyl-[acyl-carrier protein] reductase